MSVIYPPATLGPEMAGPILWAPGIVWFFLLETPMSIKFLLLGGFAFSCRGGWKCQFYFYGHGDFPLFVQDGTAIFSVCDSMQHDLVILRA